MIRIVRVGIELSVRQAKSAWNCCAFAGFAVLPAESVVETFGALTALADFDAILPGNFFTGKKSETQGPTFEGLRPALVSHYLVLRHLRVDFVGP